MIEMLRAPVSAGLGVLWAFRSGDELRVTTCDAITERVSDQKATLRRRRVYNGWTYHADVVTVKQRLTEFGLLLFAVWTCFAANQSKQSN